MEKQVICSNPTIILNPLAKESIMKYLNVVVKGKRYYFSKHSLTPYFLPWCVPPVYTRRLKFSFGKVERIKEQNIFHEDLNSCYIVPDDGEYIPLYIEVPCGHCDLCKERKTTSLVERCKMESQCYDCWPWFVTLTYDDENCPLDGVSIKDFQRFFKRFRINLQRSGYNFNLRYCATGEYGKTTHRPHYHFVVWGLDVKTSSDFECVSSILYKSWDKGYTMHRVVDPSDDKTFFYTTKYLRKDCFIPTYEHPIIDDNGILSTATKLCNVPFYFNHVEMEV